MIHKKRKLIWKDWGFEENEENETEEPEIESDWIWQILKFENLKELKFEVI